MLRATTLFATIFFAAIATGFGCSDDSDEGEPSGDGGSPDGGPASGGSPGTGGASGTGGAGPTPPPYSVEGCPGVTPTPNSTSAFPPCDDVCAAAHCLPLSLSGEGVPDSADCSDDGSGQPGKCIPDVIAEVEGRYRFGSCSFSLLGGVPGACIPICFVGAQADMLPQDECAAEEVCVPCVDPETMESTGLCEGSCDVADGGATDAGDAGGDGAVDAAADAATDAALDGALDADQAG